MDYSGLQTAVDSITARSDIPAYVYEISTSELNREVRLLSMEATSTISADAETENLPADFLEVISVYIDSGGVRNELRPFTDATLNFRRGDTGRPIYYAIQDGKIKLLPAPDGTYSVELRYYQSLDALSAGGDTNDALSDYPELYVALATRNAARWLQDDALEAKYGAYYREALDGVRRSEKRKRNSGPMSRRPSVDIALRA